jgi:PKD repeat protein
MKGVSMQLSRQAKVALAGVFLTSTMSLGASATCGEATCVPAQGAYISHFTGTGCTGTESYYLPYDNYGYQCRPWDGNGECGTIHRTVTNRSYRYNGQCYNAWPGGNTLSDFVTVYRNPPHPPPVACGFASPTYGTAPLGVWFNANCSYDPAGGPIINYQWNVGEGFESGLNDYHTYFYPGYYSVWLTVWDNEGESSTSFIGTITVN